MPAFRVRMAACALMVAFLPHAVGCTTVQRSAMVDGEAPRVEVGDRIRVVRKDGSEQRLLVATVDVDRLSGTPLPTQPGAQAPVPTVVIPTGEIAFVERNRFSVARSAGLAAAVLLLVSVVGAAELADDIEDAGDRRN